MDPIIASIAYALINGGFQVWANHTGKPAGWKPSAAEIQELLDMVDAATPEAVKAAAAIRLGVQVPQTTGTIISK